MNKTYATILLGGEDRNVERLGVMVAWVAANNLLDPVLEEAHGSAVARLKMQDLTGPEFFTTVLHGELGSAQLNEEGRAFMESYFVSGQFDSDYASCEYDGDNEWLRFKEASPKITAAFQKFKDRAAPGKTSAKILKFPFGRK